MPWEIIYQRKNLLHRFCKTYFHRGLNDRRKCNFWKAPKQNSPRKYSRLGGSGEAVTKRKPWVQRPDDRGLKKSTESLKDSADKNSLCQDVLHGHRHLFDPQFHLESSQDRVKFIQTFWTHNCRLHVQQDDHFRFRLERFFENKWQGMCNRQAVFCGILWSISGLHPKLRIGSLP